MTVSAPLVHSPKVSEDSTRPEAQTVLHCRLQRFQRGRFKLATRRKFFHGAVPAPRGDQDCSRRPLLHGEIQRALCPIERLCSRQVRRLHENKYTKVDPISTKEPRRIRELIERHALV